MIIGTWEKQNIRLVATFLVVTASPLQNTIKPGIGKQLSGASPFCKIQAQTPAHESSRGKNVRLSYDFVIPDGYLERVIEEWWVGFEVTCTWENEREWRFGRLHTHTLNRRIGQPTG